MRKLALFGIAAAGMYGAAAFAPSSVAAFPAGSPGASPAAAESLVIQTQSRQRVRSYRHGPRVVYRNRGWRPGAVIGGAAALGLLGAAAAYPYYGGGYGCFIEERPVYDAWGRYVGVQNVQVCP